MNAWIMEEKKADVTPQKMKQQKLGIKEICIYKAPGWKGLTYYKY